MYFLKFVSWFWIDYLNNTSDRSIAGLIIWVCVAVILSGISGFLNTGILLAWFLSLTIIAFVLAGFASGFIYIRNRYREWQSQVFDKLRGDDNGH